MSTLEIAHSFLGTVAERARPLSNPHIRIWIAQRETPLRSRSCCINIAQFVKTSSLYKESVWYWTTRIWACVRSVTQNFLSTGKLLCDLIWPLWWFFVHSALAWFMDSVNSIEPRRTLRHDGGTIFLRSRSYRCHQLHSFSRTGRDAVHLRHSLTAVSSHLEVSTLLA